MSNQSAWVTLEKTTTRMADIDPYPYVMPPSTLPLPHLTGMRPPHHNAGLRSYRRPPQRGVCWFLRRLTGLTHPGLRVSHTGGWLRWS